MGTKNPNDDPVLFRVTLEWLQANKTAKGGYTKAQLQAIEVAWPPVRGWQSAIIDSLISREQARAFEDGAKS